ncbi:MAG: hypothetical protein IJ542_02215 [Clostridia bacterium]|nr:hypothetical protein [Clostridia bacterium]
MKRRKLTKIFAILLLTIAVLAVVLSFKTRHDISGEVTFYFVYAKKCNSIVAAEELCKDVANRGGAGVVYSAERQNYVIISAYLNKNDANNVQNAIKSTYLDSGIIEVRGAKQSKLKKQFNKCSLYKNYYSLIVDLVGSCYELANAYETNKVSSSEVYRKTLSFRQRINDFKNSAKDNSDELVSKVYVSALVMSELIDDFYSSAFVSSSMVKYLRKLLVFSIIEWQQLNKI